MKTKRNLELDFQNEKSSEEFKTPKKQKTEQENEQVPCKKKSSVRVSCFNLKDDFSSSDYMSSSTDINDYDLLSEEDDVDSTESEEPEEIVKPRAIDFEENEVKSPEQVKEIAATPSAPVKDSKQLELIDGQRLEFDEDHTDDDKSSQLSEDEIADRVLWLLEQGANVRIAQNVNGSYNVLPSSPEDLTEAELDRLFTYSPRQLDDILRSLPVQAFRLQNELDSFDLTEETIMGFGVYTSQETDESTVFNAFSSSGSIEGFSAAGLTPPRSESPITIPGAPLGRENPYNYNDGFGSLDYNPGENDLYPPDEELAYVIQGFEYRSHILIGFASEMVVAFNVLADYIGLN